MFENRRGKFWAEVMDEIGMGFAGDAADGSLQSCTGVKLVADLTTTFTFASHQNAIPIIRSIRIENQTTEVLERARLELAATPAFLRAKTWVIDRIGVKEEITLSDRRLDLDPAYLAGLDEAERGDVTLKLIAGDRVIAEAIVPVRLLARDEWGGVADMSQLLPAFVMPNDPAVYQTLRAAAERLSGHGHSSALDGYQSGDPKRTFMLTAAIYAAVAGMGLHYAQPPVSFERRGQKVRKPTKIARDGLATCLDTTLLFAAALEGAGLNPVVILLDGHACVAVWLVKRTLPRTVEEDVAELRKAVAARELVVFETTGVTSRPVTTFQHAQKLGEEALDEEATRRFICAIDIARSRSAGIMPLASHESADHEPLKADDDETPDLPLPPAPDFPMPGDRSQRQRPVVLRAGRTNYSISRCAIVFSTFRTRTSAPSAFFAPILLISKIGLLTARPSS